MARRKNKKPFRYKVEVVLGIFILLIILNSVSLATESSPTLKIDEFQEAISSGEVDYISIIRGTSLINVTMKDGETFTATNLGYEDFLKEVAEAGVTDIRSETTMGFDLSSLIGNMGLVLFIYVMVKGVIKIGSSLASSLDRTEEGNEEVVISTTTFADVAGLSEEKEELLFAINALKQGEELKNKGMKPIRGILFDGPPGVGKTLLAKAVAGEAGVNFMSYEGGSFSQLFVGIGPMRVKAMMKKAIQNKPVVVFIDEIDTLAAKRINSSGGADREANNTLGTLLSKMDGVSSEDGILFIGATNRLDAIDSAVTRPGRFDKVIHIDKPNNKKDREEVVQVHLKGKDLKEGVTVEQVGKLCFGLSGAEIAGVLNDAIMESFKSGDEGTIDIPHIDKAVMKLYAKGVAKGSWQGKDLYRVSVHEVGHAIMNQYLGRTVVKVSVQPYSSGLGGVTVVDGDSSGSIGLRTRQELIDDIKVTYAGMVAEQVVFGDFSVGNTSDLQKATQILHHIVGMWGMGDNTILSTGYLASVAPNSVLSEADRIRMEDLGLRIREEVLEFFSKDLVKSHLISLSESLSKEEAIYEMPDFDYSVLDS